MTGPDDGRAATGKWDRMVAGALNLGYLRAECTENCPDRGGDEHAHFWRPGHDFALCPDGRYVTPDPTRRAVVSL